MKTFAVIVQGSIFFTQKETQQEAIDFGKTYLVGDKNAPVWAAEVTDAKVTQNSLSAFKQLDGSERYASKELLEKAFDAGKAEGREDALYDFGHISSHQVCKPDFESWYNSWYISSIESQLASRE